MADDSLKWPEKAERLWLSLNDRTSKYPIQLSIWTFIISNQKTKLHKYLF